MSPRGPRRLQEAVHEGCDLEVVVPADLPRLAPGVYEAVSVWCRRITRFDRTVLEIDFDVYDGDLAAGRVLARLPMFLRWTKTPTARSRFGRLLRCGGLQPSRGRPVTLQTLERKAWRVRVAASDRRFVRRVPSLAARSAQKARRAVQFAPSPSLCATASWTIRASTRSGWTDAMRKPTRPP